MKKKDFLAILLFGGVFAGIILLMNIPLSDGKTFNQEYGAVMSFIKFAVLATLGECIGLRISQGVYNREGFGVIPRAIVWGILGLGMYLAFQIYPAGVIGLLSNSGCENCREIFAASTLTWGKVGIAFLISVVMNVTFGPVFMTLHKITDTHILSHGGTLKGFFTPIQFKEIITHLDWGVQWSLVFKKTIPLFWFPAHTISFLLPGDYRILFAALLGVVLGIILSIANLKSSKHLPL